MHSFEEYERCVLVALVFAGCAIAFAVALGCGAGSKPAASSTSKQASLPGIDTKLPPTTERGTIVTNFIPPGQRLRGDGDADNPGDTDGNGDIDPEDEDSDYPTRASYKFPDEDDKTVFAYGHRSSAAQAKAIASVVKRYFAYAAAGDGSGACSLLLPSIAGSMSEAYGQGAGSSSPSAKTCQALLTGLFKASREELSEAITVVEVRVKGVNSQVVIGSRKMRSASTILTRQGGVWKIEQVLGRTLP